MSRTPFGLSSQRREELRVAFHAFDKDKTGKLDVGEMKYLLKSIGVCLSRREQRALEAEFAERGEFDYEDLLTIGQVVYNDVAIERALVLALRKLAPQGAKTVPRNVLREHLLNLGMGVKLTEEQVDMFLDICCSEDGKTSDHIKIATFIYSSAAAKFVNACSRLWAICPAATVQAIHYQ
ncbi:hypothetical protein Emag_001883 [Eimeria magna]